MFRIRFFLYSLFLFSSVLFSANAGTVKVCTQAEFDAVAERINNGEEMVIKLTRKTFWLKKPINATAPLYIKGRNATITCYTECFDGKSAIREEGEYYVFVPETAINPYSLFFDRNGEIVEVSESVDEAIGVNLTDEVVSEGNTRSAGTEAKLPIPEYLGHMKNRSFDKAFGYMDCGWHTINFLLEKADGEYFYCKTLNNCRTGNFSYDKNVYKKPVRFVIYNAEKKHGGVYYDGHCLYIPKSVGAVYMLNCKNYETSTPDIVVSSDFSMKGVKIVGYGGFEVGSKASALCEISDCQFKNCLGCGLKVTRKKDNAVREANIKNCTFSAVSLFAGHGIDLISPFDGGNYINMTSCTVTRYPKDWVTYKNANGGIWVQGNASITGNVVYNTPRCHLYFNKGVIVAKGNVLYNTDAFNDQEYRNLSSDWGLVYCNHIFENTQEAMNNQTHSILLEGNLLYGSRTYINEARGIYIDDGRGDVVCKNNIILNTQSFSIDSRNVKLTDASSARNRYEGNIVTSRYKLAAGPAVKGGDTPVTKGNLLLDEKENVKAGVETISEDTRLEMDTECYFKNEEVLVSQELYKELKRSPAWRGVKRYIGRK